MQKNHTNAAVVIENLANSDVQSIDILEHFKTN